MAKPLFTFTDDGVFAEEATGRPVELVITSKPEAFETVIHRFESTEFDFTVFSGGRQWWGELLTVLAVPAAGWKGHQLPGAEGLFGTVTPKQASLPMHTPEALAAELKTLTTGHRWR